MARNAYRGDKRRRELDKKKKREEKLARKLTKGDSTGETADTSYLEYLNPGGIASGSPPDSGEEGEAAADDGTVDAGV